MIQLSDLRGQVRQRADMENSNFISNSELDTYINNSYLELYDIVVSRFEDYYTVNTTFQIASGNSAPLPDDFYKVRGVDYDYGGSYYELRKWNFQDRNVLDKPSTIVLYPFLDYRQYRVIANSIQIVPQDKATGQYRLWYIPLAERMVVGVLSSLTIQDITYTSALGVYADGNSISITYVGGGTAGSESVGVVGQAITVTLEDGVSTAAQVVTAITNSVDASALVTAQLAGNDLLPQVAQAQTFLTGGVIQVDGITFNGWEEYVVVDAAMKCLQKEESDVSVLFGLKQALLKRIQEMAANRDAGEPERVTDVSRYQFDYWGDY